MYVEIARGTPANRGILIAHNTLRNYIIADEPLYRSVYLYSSDAKEFVDKTGKYTGTKGRSYYRIEIAVDYNKEV